MTKAFTFIPGPTACPGTDLIPTKPTPKRGA